MNQNCNFPSKAQLMKTINEVSFAVNDIQLFLDTHPHCQEARKYFEDHIRIRKEALELYAKHYGPLTIDTADDSSSKSWDWVLHPFPWENKGGCR